MRIVVYVEGLTELVFIREYLLKWYDYDGSKVSITCMELRSSDAFETDYAYGMKDAERQYTIVSVGGDKRALSKALENAAEHSNRGYDRILVLRDMYSDAYVEESAGRVINPILSEKFIYGAQRSIENAGFSGFVFCCFAIMEIEAWLLGMGWFLEKVDKRLSQQYMLDFLSFDLEKDPEIEDFQPAKRLKKIYTYINQDYNKHAHQVNSIMSYLGKSDFELLLDLDKCGSFNNFVALLTK